jgi:hypothetical protein
VLTRVIVCVCFSTCPNACILVVLVQLFAFICFGAYGCVYVLSTFPNVNVTMFVYVIVTACNYLYLTQCVHVSGAACIYYSTHPRDSVSILIKLHQVFSISLEVCQNVFSCGIISIYFWHCPYA